MDCLFCKIANKEISAIVVYEDDEIMAFRDVDPQAPTHILLMPKKHIESAAVLQESDAALLGRLFTKAADIALQEGLHNGYRLVTNVGADGGQSVPHLHLHLLGGRQLGWPPG